MHLHEPFRLDPNVKSVNNNKRLPLSIVIQKSLEYIKNRVLDTFHHQHIMLNRNPHEVIWVITVPAIWTDVAKSIMRKAAFEGKFDLMIIFNLKLIISWHDKSSDI